MKLNMRFLQVLLASLAIMPVAMAAKTPSCPPFPASMTVFSASFAQPEPPFIKSEYRTNFVQHKWYDQQSNHRLHTHRHNLTYACRNQNLSHITTGFINNSPSKGFVRVDEVFGDSGNAAQGPGSTLATSVFNYANVTNEGLVDNTLTSYTSNSTKPDVWRGYVNSNFPIIEQDMLVKAGAVFGGLAHREFVKAPVAAVSTWPHLALSSWRES